MKLNSLPYNHTDNLPPITFKCLVLKNDASLELSAQAISIQKIWLIDDRQPRLGMTLECKTVDI